MKTNFILTALITACCLLPTANSFSQDYPFYWVKGIGGTQVDMGNDIQVDPSGNIFIAGIFKTTVDMDPSVEGEVLFTAVTDNNSNNGFILKLDNDGNFLWAKHLVGVCTPTSMKLDDDGDIYIAGRMQGTVDFDPSDQVMELTAIAVGDAFMAKYNAQGELIWAVNFGGEFQDVVNSFVLDDEGNIFMSGNFSFTVDFDPGDGVSELSVGDLDTEDMYIAKFNNDGQFVWVKQISGAFLQYCAGIALDSQQNIVVAGRFSGTTDFDPGANVVSLSPTGGSDGITWDMYVLKLTVDGVFIWVKQMGSSGQDAVMAVMLDANDNIYCTSSFQFTVDFDPGDEVLEFTAFGNTYDMCVFKMGNNGNLVWSSQAGGNGQMTPEAITMDATGHIYTTGMFSGTCDFDPSSAIAESTCIGDNDIFVSVLDNNGAYLWAERFGSGISDTGWDTGYGIGVDANAVYVTGQTKGQGYFDPESVFPNFASAGYTDAFILKLGHPAAVAVDEEVMVKGMVFPNPASDFISIQGTSSQSSVVIYDSAGKMTLNANVMNNGRLDISSLVAGIYMMSIMQDGINVTKKIVVE